MWAHNEALQSSKAKSHWELGPKRPPAVPAEPNIRDNNFGKKSSCESFNVYVALAVARGTISRDRLGHGALGGQLI